MLHYVTVNYLNITIKKVFDVQIPNSIASTCGANMNDV